MNLFELNGEEAGKLLTFLGNRGAKKAQEENRRLGLPNVYCVNGQIIYELPNGEITTERPDSLKLKPHEKSQQ